MVSLPQRTGAAVVAAVLGLSIQSPAASLPDDEWRAAAESWRRTHEETLRGPDGYLAVAGLFFLKPGINTVGADPASDVVLPAGVAPARAGRIVREGQVARFEPEPGVSVQLNAQPLAGPTLLRLANSAEKRPADRIAIGRVSFHLHRSGDRLAVRLRDPGSPIRTQFGGLRWFPLEERWLIDATFVPRPPRTVLVQNILGDVEEASSPGEVAFAIGDQAVRLVAFTAGQRLWFVFRDATGGTSTYRIRFLYADAPDAQGRVRLDFNRAYNAPCAYNPHTTCPLPLPENRLTVAIPAGERLDLGSTAR